MNDVFVYLMELPGKINEMVTPCEDGYTVYVDPRQAHDGMMRSYKHAMDHIRENDFDKSDVQEIEGQAHDKAG